jgi:peroxiredoxin
LIHVRNGNFLDQLPCHVAWLVAACLGWACASCAEELPPAAVVSWPATDVQGIEHRPLAAPGTAAVVLIFTMQDCPIANGYIPELNRLQDEYRDAGVRFFLIQTDPALTSDAARQHAEEYQVAFPVLLDSEHRFVRAASATRTPEAAVYSSDGQLRYRGRIDDRYAGFGKRRAEPTSRDLRTAIEQLLSGKPVTTPRTLVVGCHIPPLASTQPQGAERDAQ